ncbi:MAG: HAD family phosphatase [Deltaproteobacteria bacterium]|nr:MAG: HAD family phosphatase [Deltaproteobacteria bacterium]
MNIKAIILDFGGVIAEEGFQQGLYAIAKKFGLDQKRFFQLANEAVYNSGYVTGSGSEHDYWNEVREHSGIIAEDEELRQEILSRFILRDWMLETVKSLKQQGLATAILSDQSDWLDQLDSRYNFFQYFDAVLNSFHLGKTKRDSSIFNDTLQELHVKAGEALFVDDNIGHIDRATAKGLQTHHFEGREGFMKKLKELGLK